MRRFLQLALIVGLLCESASAVCTATQRNKGGGTFHAGSGGTVSATINGAGDLIVGSAWCLSSTTTACTYSSVSIGTDTASHIAASIVNTTCNLAGCGFVFYDLSSGVSGAQTITFTAAGSSLADTQVSYVDFSLSAGCTAALDVTSSVATATLASNATFTTPSITASAGDVEYIFGDTAGSFVSIGAPYTQGTLLATTSNLDGYILSASGSATANAMLNSAGSSIKVAGMATSFKMTAAAPAFAPRQMLSEVGD